MYEQWQPYHMNWFGSWSPCWSRSRWTSTIHEDFEESDHLVDKVAICARRSDFCGRFVSYFDSLICNIAWALCCQLKSGPCFHPMVKGKQQYKKLQEIYGALSNQWDTWRRLSAIPSHTKVVHVPFQLCLMFFLFDEILLVFTGLVQRKMNAIGLKKSPPHHGCIRSCLQCFFSTGECRTSV